MPQQIDLQLKIKQCFLKDISSLIQILKDLDNEKLKEIKSQMFEISKRRYIWEQISKIYQNYLT